MSAGLWIGVGIALVAGIVGVLIAAGVFRKR
jgi:hypothetical protein